MKKRNRKKASRSDGAEFLSGPDMSEQSGYLKDLDPSQESEAMSGVSQKKKKNAADRSEWTRVFGPFDDEWWFSGAFRPPDYFNNPEKPGIYSFDDDLKNHTDLVEESEEEIQEPCVPIFEPKKWAEG